MTKEKLVELLKESQSRYIYAEEQAEFLLNNGVGDVLCLVENQKATIEELKAREDKLFTRTIAMAFDLLGKIKKARVKAVEDFAYEVKEEFQKFFISTSFLDRIDDLVKERVWEKDNG